MSILSLENINRLLWLGRYSERVYTTIRFFAGLYDSMIDVKSEDYKEFCVKHNISGNYDSKEDFAEKYCFDDKNQDSISYALMRAYDNAIELREEIGSDTFSYIQMSVYDMKKAKNCDAILLELQKIVDNIAAFWGVADDLIECEQTRSIIKLGKRIERIDLYARMNAGQDEIKREIRRLSYRIHKAGLKYNHENLAKLNEYAGEKVINHLEILNAVENLLS